MFQKGKPQGLALAKPWGPLLQVGRGTGGTGHPDAGDVDVGVVTPPLGVVQHRGGVPAVAPLDRPAVTLQRLVVRDERRQAAVVRGVVAVVLALEVVDVVAVTEVASHEDDAAGREVVPDVGVPRGGRQAAAGHRVVELERGRPVLVGARHLIALLSQPPRGSSRIGANQLTCVGRRYYNTLLVILQVRTSLQDIFPWSLHPLRGEAVGMARLHGR
jgi:hypothetical protein